MWISRLLHNITLPCLGGLLNTGAIMRMEISHDQPEKIQAYSPEFKRETLKQASAEGVRQSRAII